MLTVRRIVATTNNYFPGGSRAKSSTRLDDTVITLAPLNPATAAHLRLPTDWSRRFCSSCGGTDGNLGDVDAAPIGDGSAMISTDSEHDNAAKASAVAGTFQFALKPL